MLLGSQRGRAGDGGLGDIKWGSGERVLRALAALVGSQLKGCRESRENGDCSLLTGLKRGRGEALEKQVVWS